MRYVVLVMLLLVATACGGDGASEELSEADRQATIDAMTALELMAVTFEGNPSEEAISAPLLEAFECFDTPDTETNRERAGSTLVALGNEYDLAEMDILSTMLSMCESDTGLDFPEAAAFAAAALEAER